MGKSNDYAAFNINLDSFSEILGYPDNYEDPTYGVILDRFLDLAQKYSFKYSVYVIGKDLEDKRYASAIKKLADEGHEIGNHSWSHDVDLATQKQEEIEAELKKTHDIINDITGVDPQGFISPGWSTSGRLIKTLIRLGYVYDTSVFPSYLVFPSTAKLLFNYLGDKRWWKIARRNILVPSFASRQLYYSHGKILEKSVNAGEKGIWILPLPTTSGRLAIWHTLAFIYKENKFAKILKNGLRTIDAFYYLMHPADLADRRDLNVKYKVPLERIDVPLKRKMYLLEKSMNTIFESGRKIVTMKELVSNQVAIRDENTQ